MIRCRDNAPTESCSIRVCADYDQRTVTHLAASAGHKHIVDYLAMRRCIDVASKDRWGATALDDAIREGHMKLAESMVSYFQVNGYDVSKEILQALPPQAKLETKKEVVKDEELLRA